MAGTRWKVTMQGLRNPVSAVGQGGKAGPRSSPSCDRSSTCVGDLAHVEYNATRNESFHNCDKNCDMFCYICCKYVAGKTGVPINDKIKKLYNDCFDLEILNQDSNWVPHIICNSCKIMLYSKNKVIKYSKPAVWDRPRRKNDCYFCMNDTFGHNRKNKGRISYVDVSTVIKPIETNLIPKPPKADDVRIEDSIQSEEFSDNEDLSDEERSKDYVDMTDSNEDEEFRPYDSKAQPKLVSQSELNDLVRDLGLAKDGAEHLASFMKKRNFLQSETRVSFYRNRDEAFRQYFKMNETLSLVFCTNIEGLINEFQQGLYRPEGWRLFIDSSKRSIKAVLLHNGNIYAPIPIAYSTVMEEQYEKMRELLEKIEYAKHQWEICGDLKMLTILLGQQPGFTRHPCYKCLWNSRERDRHYKKKIWPARESIIPGSDNVLFAPLVDPKKVLIPPLHIKLGLMKQYTKALNKEGQCFRYLYEKFPKYSDAKIKEGVFDGPQIRKLFQDTIFITKMDEIEKAAWLSFKEVSKNFLGNERSPKYKEIVKKMVKNFQNLGCLMNLKLHFLDSHIDDFPDNCGDYSEEQGERFHQDIKVIENRYQGRWDDHMLADYCWSLKRDTIRQRKKRKKGSDRKSVRRSFTEKRTRYSRKKVD